MQHQKQMQLPSDQNTEIAVTENIKVRPAVLKKQNLNSKKTANRIKLGLPDSVWKENEESMVGSQNNRRALKTEGINKQDYDKTSSVSQVLEMNT